LTVSAIGSPQTEREIIDLCAAWRGSYTKPTRVLFRTEPPPLSPVGKVNRKAMRESFWAVSVG
jgi:hypothetical protein